MRILEGAEAYTSIVLSDVSRVSRDYDTISNVTNLSQLLGISAVAEMSLRSLKLPRVASASVT